MFSILSERKQRCVKIFDIDVSLCSHFSVQILHLDDVG